MKVPEPAAQLAHIGEHLLYRLSPRKPSLYACVGLKTRIAALANALPHLRAGNRRREWCCPAAMAWFLPGLADQLLVGGRRRPILLITMV